MSTSTPFACCGAAAIDTLDAGSIADIFLEKGPTFSALETPSDMPVLAGVLRFWSSHVLGSRYQLSWLEGGMGSALDLSHVESLCMRLSQQVRNLRQSPLNERA